MVLQSTAISRSEMYPIEGGDSIAKIANGRLPLHSDRSSSCRKVATPITQHPGQANEPDRSVDQTRSPLTYATRTGICLSHKALTPAAFPCNASLSRAMPRNIEQAPHEGSGSALDSRAPGLLNRLQISTQAPSLCCRVPVPGQVSLSVGAGVISPGVVTPVFPVVPTASGND